MAKLFDDDLTEEAVAGRIDVQPQVTERTEALPLPLELFITDPETIEELSRYPEGTERDEFAVAAIKVGTLALRHVRGQVDAEAIRNQTQQMLAQLQQQFSEHETQVRSHLTGTLKEYFDPESGRFQERVQRLVSKDGELEQLMRRQIAGEDSALAKTLVSHVGQQSPLLKMLDPKESQGLLAALKQTVDEQLTGQRRQILDQFSLDNKDGALARLVAELQANHGELNEELQTKIDSVIKEFSLDEDDSALSRLVKNVETAQQTITKEFSLDEENSSLARLKTELTTILSAHIEANAEFQEEVKITLAKLVTKRAADDKSTQHGRDFENEAVRAFLEHDCHGRNDLLTHVGDSTGRIKNRKYGDFVIQLGPESCAPDAKIVIEAKEEQKYQLSKAREEMEQARKNRDAQLGIFVYSKRVAPEHLPPVSRFGDDIVVVWDADDPATDVNFNAALSIARALCVRQQSHDDEQAADFELIDRAVLEIEKRMTSLGNIKKSAETVRSSSETILREVESTRKSLETQVGVLNDRITALKTHIGE